MVQDKKAAETHATNGHYVTHRDSRPIIFFSWVKPPLGMHKVNADGGFRSTELIGSCAVLVRDSEGNFSYAEMKFFEKMTLSVRAEAEGALLALQVLVGNHWVSSYLELDCEQVVNYLKSTSLSSVPHELRAIVQQMKIILTNHKCIITRWSNRETNVGPHILCVKAMDERSSEKWDTSPPDCLTITLNEDKIGKKRMKDKKNKKRRKST